MARQIIRPTRWNRQPTGPVFIDPSNPLADGLIDALLPVGSTWRSTPRAAGRPVLAVPQDLTLFTPVSSPTPTWGIRGFGINYIRASSQKHARDSSPLTQIAECSALVVMIGPGSEAAGNPYFSYGSAASNNPLLMINFAASNNPEFRVRDTANVNQTVTGTGGLLTANRPHVLIGTRSQAQNFQRIYCDGQLAGSATATTLGAASFNRTGVCVLRRATDALEQDGTIFLCLAWNRALQPDEVTALSLNPWQVFASPTPFQFADIPASGTTVTVDLSCLMEFGALLRLDGAAPAEFGATTRQDVVYPVEFGATLRSTGVAPAEFGSLLRLDGLAPIDWGASLRLDGPVPVEFGAGVCGDGLDPVEWGGIAAVTSDSLGPLEWGSTIRGDRTSPEDVGASVRRDMAEPITFGASILADLPAPITWSANLRTDAPSPTDFGASVRHDAVAPLAWSQELIGELVGRIEWTGHDPVIAAAVRIFSGYEQTLEFSGLTGNAPLRTFDGYELTLEFSNRLH